MLLNTIKGGTRDATCFSGYHLDIFVERWQMFFGSPCYQGLIQGRPVVTTIPHHILTLLLCRSRRCFFLALHVATGQQLYWDDSSKFLGPATPLILIGGMVLACDGILLLLWTNWCFSSRFVSTNQENYWFVCSLHNGRLMNGSTFRTDFEGRLIFLRLIRMREPGIKR
jgi:hypothetical protein